MRAPGHIDSSRKLVLLIRSPHRGWAVFPSVEVFVVARGHGATVKETAEHVAALVAGMLDACGGIAVEDVYGGDPGYETLQERAAKIMRGQRWRRKGGRRGR